MLILNMKPRKWFDLVTSSGLRIRIRQHDLMKDDVTLIVDAPINKVAVFSEDWDESAKKEKLGKLDDDRPRLDGNGLGSVEQTRIQTVGPTTPMRSNYSPERDSDYLNYVGFISSWWDVV